MLAALLPADLELGQAHPGRHGPHRKADLRPEDSARCCATRSSSVPPGRCSS
ncbi:MAG: hypothetical protein MZV64_59980 [Ignavibacteriales bacterium]|nr:hypothetical protein [Ignavibacteriales bacterium]